jgi:hypothetical protein
MIKAFKRHQHPKAIAIGKKAKGIIQSNTNAQTVSNP